MIKQKNDDMNKWRSGNTRFYPKGNESYVLRFILLGRTEIRGVKTIWRLLHCKCER